MWLNKLNKAISKNACSGATPFPENNTNQCVGWLKQLLLVLFFVPMGMSTIYSQSCFTELADFSGFDTAPYQDSLNAWACQVKDVLPTEFQDDFQVFDFGFYTHKSQPKERYFFYFLQKYVKPREIRK